MTDLKTLKDLPRIVLESDLYDAVDSKDLKKEAIKRYHHWNNERKEANPTDDIWFILTGRILEIVENFNLTDEDIKSLDGKNAAA